MLQKIQLVPGIHPAPPAEPLGPQVKEAPDRTEWHSAQWFCAVHSDCTCDVSVM